MCRLPVKGLQCGHDPKAVENYGYRHSFATRWLLQCGHDPKAVENSNSRGRYYNQALKLQCGHDPKAVENVGVGHDRERLAAASMRPRPEGRGELTCRP